MNAYKINNTGLLSNGSDAFGNFSAQAIFTSTVKYLQFPTDLANTMINFLLYDKVNKSMILKDDVDGQYYYYATCNYKSYPSIYLRLEDTWFQIQSSTFILESPANVNGDYCRIGISSSLSDDVLLGIVFIKNYYMIFDTDNDQVGISTHNVTRSIYMVGGPPIH